MRANAGAADKLLAVLALSHWVAASMERKLLDRQSAVQLRAEIGEIGERVLARLDDPNDGQVRDALRRLIGEAMATLTEASVSLAPVISVETPQRLPAVVVSQTLYGTAARADELAARNRASHQGMLPERLEALAR